MPVLQNDYGPYLEVADATELAGIQWPYLCYRGPQPPAEPDALQALLLAYRSEVLLRCAAERSPVPFVPTQLRFEELRLRLPHFYYDDDEGLPSDEPLFDDLYARLQRWRTLILLGPSGSGKTTALRQLACDLAYAGLMGDPQTPLPILIDLSSRSADRDGPGLLCDALTQANLTDPPRRPHPIAAHRLLAQLIPTLLAERRPMILLWDGLDEAPYNVRGTTGALIEKLEADSYGKILNLVACRADRYDPPVPYGRSELHVTTKRAAILPLESQQIREQILARLGAEQGGALLHLLEQPAHTVAAALARNPLVLGMLCELYAAYNELPTSRGRLLQGVAAARLAALQISGAAVSAELLLRALGRAAFELTAIHGRGSAALLMHMLSWIAEVAPAADAEQLLHRAWQAGLLAVVNGGAALRFSHPLIQEYCAALDLRDQFETNGRPLAPGLTATLKRLPEPGWQRGWEDTILLLASMLSPGDRVQPQIRELLSTDPLAFATCFINEGGTAEPELAGLLRSTALEQIADPGREFRQRLSAGRALGLAGDPRYPVTLAAWRTELGRRNEQFGAPPGYLCYVRAGRYRIGGWKEDLPEALLELPDFWIARLPITVAQFALFAEHGYTDDAQHLWTPNGWAWRTQSDRTAPNAWDDSHTAGPNRPVSGVSWYEADAFCAWLTAQLAHALPPGFVLRLPTEAEWEATAAFDAAMRRHPYPWGEGQATPAHAVLKASGVPAPAPVGCCPAGAAACGALDLLGNIEEWCASRFGAYPAGSTARADDPPSGGNIHLGPLQEGQLPTRGGWWLSDAAVINCGERFWRYASASSDSIGFRVVLARR